MKRSPMKRGKRLKSKGARATRRQDDLDECYRLVRQRSGGWCEAKVHTVCAGRATENHHVGKRSVWPELVTNVDNVIAVCRWCHGWIDDNQAEAERLGLHMPRTFDNEVRFGLKEAE